MVEAGAVRVDKWLWVTRFFKTRSLAAVALAGGKIRVNGAIPKASRELRPGDELDIHVGDTRYTVVVRGVATQRRPASEARLLYAETEESVARRAREAEMRRLAPVPGSDIKGRPTKRSGRLIRKLG